MYEGNPDFHMLTKSMEYSKIKIIVNADQVIRRFLENLQKRRVNSSQDIWFFNENEMFIYNNNTCFLVSSRQPLLSWTRTVYCILT